MKPREAAEKAFYECEGNNQVCLKAAFDAYEAAAQQMTPVKVKPLEWTEIEEGARSITVCGYYAISPSRDKYRLTLIGQPSKGLFETVAAAKAVAQADYERRILSAIASSSKPRSRKGKDMSEPILHRVARAIMDAGTGCEVTDWREAE